MDGMQESGWSENGGELLYNGVRLPSVWPPQDMDGPEKSPMPVPYLESPPDVVSIDTGRQLFVDDFLIEQTDLKRIFHKPEKYSGNPILQPETALELNRTRTVPHCQGEPGNAAAVPKSGGIWWDADEQHFKMWYEAGWINTIALATSRDGLHWQRPEFDIRPGSNQVLPVDMVADSWTVTRNWDSNDPAKKWVLFVQPPGGEQPGTSLFSSDGIHWERRARTGEAGDRSTLFYNPFRKKWVYSLRACPKGLLDRARAYYECDDPIKDAGWKREDRVFWLRTDREDLPDPEIGRPVQLYNVDAVAYESLMLGMFELLLGPKNEDCEETGLPKTTDLQFAFSRDGFHFSRPDRRAHIRSERRDVWDRGYVQSVGNVCVVVGDELWFYYSAFQGDGSKTGRNWLENGMYDRGATGIAILRRDGFASMEAGDKPGMLTTRPVRFSGRHLFVNAAIPAGSLRAELLDEEGVVIEPFTLQNSIAFKGDRTLQKMAWEGADDLSELNGKPVRFRFELAHGALYSFWVSKDRTGRSDGYIAGGGPGYDGPTDTVGSQALFSAEEV